MTSTELQLTASDALSASPLSESASFEIIDAPGADVSQSTRGEGTPDGDPEVPAQDQHALGNDRQLLADTEDALAELSIHVHSTLLRQPLIIHVIASRARASFLMKDFVPLLRAVEPLQESPKTSLKLSALNLRAATHVLLSTLPDDPEFCSRLARHPVLSAIATHRSSDSGALAYMYVLINSPEGEELARRVAHIHAERVRDWLASRAMQAMPAYKSLTAAMRTVWGQST